jgi:hypothetical protein
MLIENMLKALVESLAYLIAPKNQAAVVELIMKKLRLKDSVTAEEGYHDAVRTMARKPYPALDGMRNVQRLLKTQNPRVGEVNLDEIVDDRFIRKMDESGFFERTYVNCNRLPRSLIVPLRKGSLLDRDGHTV